MDLYGDLPPTTDGGNGGTNSIVIGAGWAKQDTSLATKISSSHPTKKPNEEKKPPKALMPQVAVRKSIPTVSFKPRQAAILAVQPLFNSQTPSTHSSGLLGPVITSEIISRKKLGELEFPTTHHVADAISHVRDEISRESPSLDFHKPCTVTYDCTDPYDPAKPNDYIAWCEERVERRRQRQLEKDNAKVLEEMERTRAALEQERAEAMQMGDMVKLQATLPSMGRGRGRGITNLPAWMTSAVGAGDADGAISLQSPMKQTSPVQIQLDHQSQNLRQESGQFDDMSSGGENIYGTNLGSRMLSNMGFEGNGNGLGKSGQGIVNAIEVRSHGGQGHIVVSDMDKDRILGRKREESRGANTIGGYDDNHVFNGDGDFGSDVTSGGGGSKSGNMKRKKLFANPSCVVLLKNMVAAGDVDESLAPETQEECNKYGQVKSCVVRELPQSLSWSASVPDSERVRTFVCFERQDSAVRAYRDMNGRFFGGRQITAVFYDEAKYDNQELDPSPGEW